MISLTSPYSNSHLPSTPRRSHHLLRTSTTPPAPRSSTTTGSPPAPPAPCSFASFHPATDGGVEAHESRQPPTPRACSLILYLRQSRRAWRVGAEEKGTAAPPSLDRVARSTRLLCDPTSASSFLPDRSPFSTGLLHHHHTFFNKTNNQSY
jgi:hypothetical protein